MPLFRFISTKIRCFGEFLYTGVDAGVFLFCFRDTGGVATEVAKTSSVFCEVSEIVSVL